MRLILFLQIRNRQSAKELSPFAGGMLMEQGYVNIQRSKNGVHITGTRFAIVYWKNNLN